MSVRKANAMIMSVYVLNMPIEDFYQLFLDSSFSDKFAAGDSSTIAGKSGPEIAYAVLREKGYDIEYKEPEYVIKRTPEYWTGWVLCQLSLPRKRAILLRKA